MTFPATLSEMSARIAATEKRSPADENLILRQLRHLHSLGLIQATGAPRDARGTAQFDAQEFWLARLMLAGLTRGLGTADLVFMRSSVSGGAVTIESVVSSTREGADWWIEIAEARPETNEPRSAITRWTRRDPDGSLQVDHAFAEVTSPDARLGDGRVIEVVSYIKASTLLRPYLD